MTENLVELVARSGIFDYDRGDKIKRIADAADKAACEISSTNGILTNALDDAGITENAALIYKPLAMRINGVRNQVMMHRPGNVPVVQACSIIEAVDETVCRLFGTNRFAHKYMRRWTLNAQSLTDAGLVFHTVASWLSYIHTKTDEAKHRRVRDDRALFFLCTLMGKPRREYSNVHEAVSYAQLVGMQIGDNKFESDMRNKYFDLPQ